jgi:cholesterol transport system auxiliary component
MKTEKIIAPFAALAFFMLAACSSIGPGPAPQLYVLAPQVGALGDAPQVSWQLVVAEPDAPQSLSTARIALTRGANLDYYANAAWADRAPALVQDTLVDAFDKSGKIAAVAPDTAGVRGDYRLETELRDFSAHYDTQDGIPTVTVRIVAKLVAADGRQIVASLDSVHTQQASANSVPAVVEAFDGALSASLEEIAGWALKAPPAGH